MGGQGCATRGHGYGTRMVRSVRHVVPSQVVWEDVGEWPGERGVAGGGVGRGWSCGPRAVVGVEWVRRCAAPRQTQWSALQGGAVCGSRWHVQRGHRVAGGWRYLWMDGCVGAWGLMARACWRLCVRCLWCSLVPCRCCACWMVYGQGGGGSRVGWCVPA